MSIRTRALRTLASLGLVGLCAALGPARAEPLAAQQDAKNVSLEAFAGVWSGSGRIELESGNTETLRCIGYYRSKSGGQGLGLALRCASPSSNLELRAELLNASGSAISGTWEERTFNATGAIAGKIEGNALRMTIAGPGFNGTMQASLDGAGQRVALATDGIALKGVTISFQRSEDPKRRGPSG